MIEVVPEPRPFHDVIESWQRERNRLLVPPLEFIGGLNPDYNGPTNFWLGYSKGHDKTSYCARILNWILAFAPRKRLRTYCCAKDAEQAEVLYDAMVKETELNLWMKPKLNFKRNLVEGTETGSQLHILNSDAGGVHGKTPDLIICDELTNWNSDRMWSAIQSSKVKRSTAERNYCVTMVLTNAGYIGSWQHDLRNYAEQHPTWHFFEQQSGTQLASWMQPDTVADVRRTFPEAEAKRLFDNRWINPAEERGAFRPDDVDRCVGKPEFPAKGAAVVLAVDYGSVKDRTALCSAWWDGTKLQVFELDCWQGSHEQPVQIEEIDKWLDTRLLNYPDATCVFDPAQMLASMQRLEKRGAKVKAFNYKGGRQNQLMAENMRNLLMNQQIVFSEYAGFVNGDSLVDELKAIVAKSMSYGWRLDHKNNKHDDRVVVVGMAALEAITSAPPPLPPKQLKTQLTTETKRPVGGGFNGRNLFARRGLFGTK